MVAHLYTILVLQPLTVHSHDKDLYLQSKDAYTSTGATEGIFKVIQQISSTPSMVTRVSIVTKLGKG